MTRLNTMSSVMPHTELTFTGILARKPQNSHGHSNSPILFPIQAAYLVCLGATAVTVVVVRIVMVLITMAVGPGAKVVYLTSTHISHALGTIQTYLRQTSHDPRTRVVDSIRNLAVHAVRILAVDIACGPVPADRKAACVVGERLPLE